MFDSPQQILDTDSPPRTNIHRGEMKIEDFLTIEEVCYRLGYRSITPVRYRVKAGVFHPIKGKKKGGKVGALRLLFNPLEIDEELDRVAKHRHRAPVNLTENRGGRLPQKRKEDFLSKASISKPSLEPPIDPSDIDESIPIKKKKHMADSLNGEKCAEAAKLFNQGKTKIDVVIAMNLDFRTTKYFWEEYIDAQPGWFLSPKAFARMRGILNWNEDPATPEGFLRAFNLLVQNELKPQLSDESPADEATALEAALSKENLADDNDE